MDRGDIRKELIRDVVFILGLVLMGCGLWMIYPAAALIGIGAILSILAYKSG